jgi:hypothetical protein
MHRSSNVRGPLARLPAVLSLACAGALAIACGGTMQAQTHGTERAPALKADIEIDDDDGAREVDLELHELPPPETLGAQYTQYGVWLLPEGGGAPVRVGTLEYQDDILYGGIEALSPFQRFEIVVSAEPDEPGPIPSQAVVLRHRIP